METNHYDTMRNTITTRTEEAKSASPIGRKQ